VKKDRRNNPVFPALHVIPKALGTRWYHSHAWNMTTSADSTYAGRSGFSSWTPLRGLPDATIARSLLAATSGRILGEQQDMK